MFISSIYWKQLGAEIYLNSMMLDKNTQISDSLSLFSNLIAAKSTSGIRKHVLENKSSFLCAFYVMMKSNHICKSSYVLHLKGCTVS